LYHRFYNKKVAPVKKNTEKTTFYGTLLSKILRVKWLVILVGFSLVGISFLLIPLIGSEFMPQTQSKEFLINLKLSEGTKLERTESTVQNIETILTDYLENDLHRMYSHAGPDDGFSSGQSAVFQGENTAEIKVILSENSTRTADDVIATIDKLTTGIPNLEVSFSKDETALQSILGTDVAPLVVEIKGTDMDEIERVSLEVKEKMEGIAGLYNIQTSIEDGAPEVEVVIDRIRAGLYGLDLNTVVTQLQDQLQGKNAGQLEKGGEMRDITIKLPETPLSDIGTMTVRSGTQVFRITEIAELRQGVSPREIYRRNQNRIGKITAQMEPGMALQHAASQIRSATSGIPLQPDYSIQITGDEEKRQETMSSLGFALILSIILVYMVMAAQFESLIHPFTILLTIPFAVVGSIITFFLLGRTLNIMAIIGIIMLVGIAVNNSIILVDRINQLIREGLNRRAAIILAGQQRIRPIIMTSLTTILALLPLTIGFGESAALRSPMALAVIGGLITSTLLTLVVIPCVYDVLDRVRTLFVRTSDDTEINR
jgi:hydrophobic/amphiphilic exporter-1 (mainly G- bacteria), HAE1 family